MPAKLCLNMIVKNEEEIIIDCLKNVCHLCDAVAVVDTTSDDKSVKLIRKFCEKNQIPCEVIVRPWLGFDVSRTEALRFGEDVIFRYVRDGLKEVPKPPQKWKPDFETNLLSLDEFNEYKIKEKKRLDRIRKGSKDRSDNIEIKPPSSKSRGSATYDGTQFLKERLSTYKKEELKDDWYLMFMDADNRLRVNNWNSSTTEVYQVDKTKMTDEQYFVDMRQNTVTYRYSWMVKVNPEKRWVWRKEIHEHIVPYKFENPTRGKLVGGYIESGRSGARNKNPVKYSADAVICEKWMILTPDDDHNFFYHAQSARDAGKREESIRSYLKRAQMQGWSEQVYISYLEAGKQEQDLYTEHYDGKHGPPVSFQALEYFYRAFEVCKNRLEAPYFITNSYRQMGLFILGWEFCKPLIDMVKGTDLLFMDEQINGWLFYDSAYYCAFHAGDYEGAKKCAEKALASGTVPSEHQLKLQNMVQGAQQMIKK